MPTPHDDDPDPDPHHGEIRQDAGRIVGTPPRDLPHEQHPDGTEADEAGGERWQAAVPHDEPGPHREARDQGQRSGQQVCEREEPADDEPCQNVRPRSHSSHLRARGDGARMHPPARPIKVVVTRHDRQMLSAGAD
jgi:hypothetical protein